MSRFFVLLLFATLVGLGFAFLYQPSGRTRWGRVLQRVRIVAYAYIAAIVLSAILRLTFGWGT